MSFDPVYPRWGTSAALSRFLFPYLSGFISLRQHGEPEPLKLDSVGQTHFALSRTETIPDHSQSNMQVSI